MMALDGWSHIFNSKYFPEESGWADQADLTWRVPFFSLFVWAAFLPGYRFLVPWLQMRNGFHKRGLCRVCGYDLRASKDRCPECGTAIPAGVQAA
jgi:hypothetical protein